MVEIYIHPKEREIELRCMDHKDWPVAMHSAPNMIDHGPGVYKCKLSHQNLTRIFSIFTGPKRPVIKSNQWLVDKIRNDLIKYNQHCEKVEKILSMDSYPTEPNGLFIPYKHQTKIIGLETDCQYPPIIADCGTGKTGSTLRAIEIAISKGTINKGKVLVSATLSTLKTAWVDDAAKFTNLKCAVLRPKGENKKIKSGKKETLISYPEKPIDSVSVKKKKRNFFKNRITGGVRRKEVGYDKIPLIDKPEDWDLYEATVNVSYDSSGKETEFGEVIGQSFFVDNTKEKFMIEQLSREDVDVFITNHHSVVNYRELLKNHGFEWVIVDESTVVKNVRSEMHQAHVDISWKAEKRNILTGTVNPNGFIDLWGQFYFLDRGMTLEPYLKDYLAVYFNPILMGEVVSANNQRKAMVKYVPKRERLNELIEKVRRTGIYIDQRDCVDLPPRVDLVREVELSSEQEDAYIEMENRLVTEYESITVEAVNRLSMIMKLRQITSGFMINQDKQIVRFKTNPKTQDLKSFLEELGGKKIVVASWFNEEIDMVAESTKEYNPLIIRGGVSADKRNEYIKEFQTNPLCQEIILQPAAAAHGITLTAAHYFYFISLDYNFEYYYQMGKRIERIGQKERMFFAHAIATLSDGSSTIDEDFLHILQDKGGARSQLMKSSGMSQSAIADYLMNNMRERVRNRKKRK